MIAAAFALLLLQPAIDAQPMGEPSPAEIARAYPPQARKARLGAEVVMGCTVDTSGLLQDCEVLAENPTGFGFAEAALGLTGRFTFTPATLGGQPVETRRPIAVNFAPPRAPSLSRFRGPAVITGGAVALLALLALARWRTRTRGH